MSYEEFRRRIDTARQILVGAVPSPAGQIDQITYALMYKFMNDIDDQAAALGGKRTYFTGDYSKYNWHELMKPGLEAHDQLELYRQAIQGMSKNPGLPPLFREIYQNAFLPFNSPNVLRLFLEEINKFSHGDTDDIGDAYEYLLSITGAQGDVGQFRTPRHIIKFIVEAVNPGKDDTVLDPAVGTAGFLIAAYNHVKSQHDGKDGKSNANDEKRLTADELEKLHHNYRGFDIDPTMVRTASVNMYLHGFTSPDIRNHDSLSNEDYWNDRYDVILANPPFMTPKGGIQPHKKFSVAANRAEVLFVDYIASHLKPNGRAGVIVPEGIIFQSGKAYKELRKNLVENYLYAVVSLPAGVFQPYSGVKTSVLLMDKQLAKERDDILFINITNTGVTLDAKQTKKTGNQLPEVVDIINHFKGGGVINSSMANAVPRELVLADPDYNLTGTRYRINEMISGSSYPLVELSELVTESRERVKNESYPVWSVSNKHGFVNPEVHFSKQVASEDKSNYKIIAPRYFAYNPSRINVGSLALNKNNETGCVSPMYVVFAYDENRLLSDYLLALMRSTVFDDFVREMAQGAVRTQLKFNDLIKFKIPLPPIETQREIVAELDGYQTIIDSAQTIVKTYKPAIKINPDWEIAKLESLIKLTRGITYNKGDEAVEGHKVLRANNIDLDGQLNLDDVKLISGALEFKDEKKLHDDDIFICLASGSKDHVGKVAYIDHDLDMYFGGFMGVIRSLNKARLNSKYLYYSLISPLFNNYLRGAISGANINNLNSSILGGFQIPLPPIEVQRDIVAKLEAERQLIDANKKLIEIYQQKIKSKLAEIWGE